MAACAVFCWLPLPRLCPSGASATIKSVALAGAQAVTHNRKALAIDEKYAHAHFNLGVIFQCEPDRRVCRW